jgi:LemA protein
MVIALIVIGVIVLLLIGWVIGGYNGLIKLRNLVQEAWAQIDTELKRRHDLIGNLVETVKGYAQHERGTFEEVTRARANAMKPGQGPAEAAKSEAALTQALVSLNAVAEAYPDLKANQNFIELQQELTSTEDRIASARRYYNANVRELNTKVETVPSNIIAGVFNIGRAEYFEVEGAERDPIKVDFGTGASGAGGAAPPTPGAPTSPAPSPSPQDSPQADPAGTAEGGEQPRP